MSKPDKQVGIEEVMRKLRALGDTLRRAAKNADALDLKPEVKAWLLDQFGPNKTKGIKSVTDETLEFAGEVVRQQLELEERAAGPITDKGFEKVREIVRQQWEQKHPAKPTSGKNRHAETEQGRRKSKQKGDDLPPH